LDVRHQYIAGSPQCNIHNSSLQIYQPSRKHESASTPAKDKGDPIYLELIAFLDDIYPEHPVRLLLLQVADILRDVYDLDLRHLQAVPHTNSQHISQLKVNPPDQTQQAQKKSSTFLEGGSACCFAATCAEISRAIRSQTWHRMYGTSSRLAAVAGFFCPAASAAGGAWRRRTARASTATTAPLPLAIFFFRWLPHSVVSGED
jgi:hypothetical protein